MEKWINLAKVMWVVNGEAGIYYGSQVSLCCKDLFSGLSP